MKQTETLVVGASIAGLAVAACLQKEGIDYIISLCFLPRFPYGQKTIANIFSERK